MEQVDIKNRRPLAPEAEREMLACLQAVAGQVDGIIIADQVQERNHGIVTDTLPWRAGAAGLLLYLLTLNHWVSLLGLSDLARVSGWLWQPQTNHPLTALVLSPMRLLPEGWVPPAMNLLAAVCASLVLALLARSVALLPHDLTREDPLRKKREVAILSTPPAWIPPALAVLVCGLQISFWEHATNFTGEMLDLLLFAWVVRCLLEFQFGRNQAWLSKAAFVFGLGMANNWAMVGYLPVFVAGVWRVKGVLSFLRFRFLARMALWGLAGASLYLLLPMLLSCSPDAGIGFWPALKANLRSQRLDLGRLQNFSFRIVVGIALLPALMLSIRWKTHTVQTGDDSRLGIILTRATGHFIHGLFLCVAIWLALDPMVSPRQLNLGMTMLTGYYACAMVAGYCAGHFLVVQARHQKRAMPRRAARVLAGAICLLPLVLGWRNLPQIRLTNGPALREFARRFYADLPAGQSVTLSEDAAPLFLLRAEMASRHYEKNAVLLHVPSLPFAQYQLFMAARCGSNWPVELPTNRLRVLDLRQNLELVNRFAARNPVVYLHPAFGWIFEDFRERPAGSVYQLVARQPTDPPGALLDRSLVTLNERIWQAQWTNSLQAFAPVLKPADPHPSIWDHRVLKRIRLASERNATISILGAFYSKSLNYWGVQMERQDRWTEAAVWFDRASQLNPDNLSARINLEFNRSRQQEGKTRLDEALILGKFREAFDRASSWGELFRVGGPFDEPSCLQKSGRAFLEGGCSRQAMRELARCIDLAPDWLEPKVWLAGSLIAAGNPSSALALADHIQRSLPPEDHATLAQLLFCRVEALWNLGRKYEANDCLQTFIRQHYTQLELLFYAADLFDKNHNNEQALMALDALVEQAPENTAWVVRKGACELRLERFNDAIATLTGVLKLAPSEEAPRLLRAMARVGEKQFEAARADYEQLLTSPINGHSALMGLADVAWQLHETNTAIPLLERLLAQSSPGSSDYALFSERLRQLKINQTH